jgi:hypothetical protein
MRRNELKKVKRDEAVERQARWAALSTAEKIADLDRRGERAKKQREKLAKKAG